MPFGSWPSISLPLTWLLPFLLALDLGSGLAQFGLNTLLRQGFCPNNCCVVLGSVGFHKYLQQELLWARQATRLDQASLIGESFVVEGFNAPTPEQQHHLLRLQPEGGSAVLALGWSEQVRHRFPPDLLQTADLLRGEFASPHGSLQKRLKRLGDVLVSDLLLLLTAPLLLLAGLMIRLEGLGSFSKVGCAVAS